MESVINNSVLEKGAFSPLKNKLALICSDLLSFSFAFFVAGIYLFADGSDTELNVEWNDYRFLFFLVSYLLPL